MMFESDFNQKLVFLKKLWHFEKSCFMKWRDRETRKFKVAKTTPKGLKILVKTD